jgi:CNP1-like family
MQAALQPQTSMPFKNRVLPALAAWVLGMSSMAIGQVFVEDPDWKEVDVPAAPAFDKDRLIPVTMPPYVTLRFGVDPATLTITSDGVIRYVMVAQSSVNSGGASNGSPSNGSAMSAMYEGIRCASGEFKTYARFSAAGQWAALNNPQWRSLYDNNTSKHALALARQGACDGRSARARSVAAIISALKNPPAIIGQ